MLSMPKFSKKLLCGALLVSCLGISALAFAEAKAYEVQQVLHASYVHTMCNEFFIRNANIYNAQNQENSWGEVIAREESGMDGSVTFSYHIGDLKRDAANNFVLHVKRHVIKKMDNSGKVNMHQTKDTDYNINLYHRMESGVKLVWDRSGAAPCTDIDGEYITSLEYPIMSSEAAMYVLERYLLKTPVNRNKLLGSLMVHSGDLSSDSHIFKLLEHHPDHVVTRGTYRVNSNGTILEYDVATDKWNEVTH